MKEIMGIRDQVLLRIWQQLGGSAFRAAQAWEVLADAMQDRVLRDAYQHADPYRSSAIMLGRMLAGAADTGYRSANGIGVARKHQGLYVIVSRGVLEVVEVRDRAAVLDTLRELGVEALAIVEAGARLRHKIDALERALGRDEVDADANTEAVVAILAAIAEQHGDRCVSLRTLAPIIGRTSADKARFLSWVGRRFEHLELDEAERDARTGWRLFRVALAE